jgi:hypothetical protein
MPDDPNTRGPQDRGRVSQQEHEKAYQNKKGSNREEDRSAGQRGGDGKKNSGGDDDKGN